MEAVVSAFAHDDNINAHLLLHLFFMQIFDIIFGLCLKVIIQLAQAYAALLILPGLPMPVLLLLVHFLQELPHGYLHVLSHRSKLARLVVCESFGLKKGAQVWVKGSRAGGGGGRFGLGGLFGLF